MDDARTSIHHELIPALRPVELTPAESGGESLAVLRDRYGIAPEPLVVRAAILPFLQLFDGHHTILDLQAALTQAVGQLVPSSDVQQFVQQFDQAMLLETETFERQRDQLLDDFRRQPRRALTHADLAYPADPEQLRALLDGYRAAHAPPPEPPTPDIIGLIAPHIDYERGARCYARTYRQLEVRDGSTGPAPDLYVLLGTAHVGLESLFSVLGKPFATPLVDLPVDVEVADDLERQLGPPAPLDLLAHRSEHSLEVTANYLAYTLGGRPAPILPVLCGFGYLELKEGGAGLRQAIDDFLGKLHETLDRHGRRACLIAGADLAHVGPRFGDPEPVSDAQLAEVESADRQALCAAAAGDAEGFADAILAHEDRHRVCGLGAIYSLLGLLTRGGGEVRGELIDYGQALDEDRSQCVTFAGLSFSTTQSESDGGST